MSEQVLIIDFGAQYTQLIARRVRESEIDDENLFGRQPIVRTFRWRTVAKGLKIRIRLVPVLAHCRSLHFVGFRSNAAVQRPSLV